MSEKFHTATLQVGKALLRYGYFGNGSKNLLLLPGLSLKPVIFFGKSLAVAFARFTQDFTIYVWDRRLNMPEHYTMQETAEDVAGWMHAIGLPSVSIFGASYGGMLAQQIAVSYPERVDKLILASTISKIYPALTRIVQPWIELAAAGKNYELNQEMVERSYAPATLQAYRDALLPLGYDITPEEMQSFVKMATSILTFDVYNQLDKITCPVLFVGCTGDRAIEVQEMQALAQKVGARTFLYGTEYGHAVYDEAPDFRARMWDFLQNP